MGRRTAARLGAVLLVSIVALATAAAAAAQSLPSRPERASKETTVKIRMTINGTALTATLVDNDTSRDFASLLPLTLTLEDCAKTEKISDLPRRLSTKGAPGGIDPSIGDIAYYAPWGNLAVFYKDFGYSKGLVKLGTLDSGVDAFSVPGSLEVTTELAR